MLERVAAYLRCPVCRAGLAVSGRTLRCEGGHHFDVARQGYVNLLAGGARAGSGDSAAMVRARQTFLAAGHLRPLAELLAGRAARLAGENGSRRGGLVAEVGAGTGYYLAAVLDRVAGHVGLALDLSKHASARAARAHPRVGAVVCDAWRPLPLRSGVVSLLLNVFAPRNGAEFRRVLRPDGALLVVTPTPHHLRELVEALGLVTVDPRKGERVRGALDAHFEPAGETWYETRLRLHRADIETLVQMGPSAYHRSPRTLRDRVAALPERLDVTVALEVRTYRPRGRALLVRELRPTPCP